MLRLYRIIILRVTDATDKAHFLQTRRASVQTGRENVQTRSQSGETGWGNGEDTPHLVQIKKLKTINGDKFTYNL